MGPSGHILHDERLKVENITERCSKAILLKVMWTRAEYNTISEYQHWRRYHLELEEEEEKTRSREGWAVSTET